MGGERLGQALENFN